MKSASVRLFEFLRNRVWSHGYESDRSKETQETTGWICQELDELRAENGSIREELRAALGELRAGGGGRWP